MAKPPTRVRTLKAVKDAEPAIAAGWVPKELDRTAGRMHESREGLVKAMVVGSDIQASNVMQGVDEAERRFHLAGAIEPPYNPTTLAAMLEHSNSLRQNVDAYATNIDGFGHRFEPIVDLDAKDANDRIAQAMYMERQAAPGGIAVMPTPEEIQARKKEIVELMRAEKVRLENFFEYCVPEMSFVTLRRRNRQDLEVIGNGFTEVLRNGLGEPAEFTYVPGFTVRLLPLDKELTEVVERRKTSTFGYESIKRKRQFRRYVQVFEAFTVYFKEYGDPRTMSRKTGAIIENPDTHAWGDGDGPATELLHFKIHSSRTAYGVPRWIGNLLSVLGSRQAEEVNFLYFENKSVPPLALLVSGGRMTEEAVKRIENYVSSEIKGKKNFHKILVLEAVGADSSNGLGDAGKTKIELKPLTDAQQKDSLFGAYDERNMDKVGMAFRMPKMLRGDIRDFNRATADAALEFAEQQVFAPERTEFDFIVNRKILTDLGIKYWRFTSLTPTVKDSATLATIVKDLVVAGVITPEEARELCTDVFNKELAVINAAWTKQPIQLTLGGVSPTDPTSTPYTGAGERVGANPAAYDDRDADGETDKAAGGGFAVTRTALGQVVTVNEARRAHNLEPWTAEQGGEMSIAAYQERMKARSGQPQQAAKDSSGDAGGAVAGSPMPSGADGSTLVVNDLRDRAGLLGPAQGRRRRRASAEKTAADSLVAIRDALIDGEAKKAASEFYARKRLELRGQLTDEAVRAAIPLPEAPEESGADE